MDQSRLQALADALGYDETPYGFFYTDVEPAEGYAPKPSVLPTIQDEQHNRVDWPGVWKNFQCVLGRIWLARKKKTAAYFSAEKFGCLGGAFYLGYNRPQLEFIVHYVSTGLPGVIDGENYLSSPEATRRFFDLVTPEPAPAKYAVFKPLTDFGEGETPLLVSWFARPEVISGLHQLAAFVTDDLEVVTSPFGAGCTNLVAWPLKYLQDGSVKAVLGGWDPSCRKFLKTDEITFTVPREMFEMMIERWENSFLRASAWRDVRKKIERSRRAWGEAGG
ncbi:MAG: DUF169 domain-containing protein [Proteobacteria bacterium]|nr:DUF169 domain-containing protein [Pseudomonadota bacterium]